MHVLIIGGNGYIGNLLVSSCVKLGWRVTVFDQTAPAETRESVGIINGDRNKTRDMRRAAGGNYDVVIDLIGYHKKQADIMVRVWRGRIDRFIYLSTISVYIELLSEWSGESEVVRISTADKSYGSGKAQYEKVLEKAFEEDGFPAVILRSAPLMGPADPVSRENYFLKRILEGRTILHPGPLNGYVLLLYVQDLIDAIISAVSAERVAGKTYHLAQSDCPTLSEHITAIGSAAGVKEIRIKEVEMRALAAYGFRICAFPYSPASLKRINIERARQDLGFCPRPYAEALENTVKWILEKEAQNLPAWVGRGSTQSLLCGTHELLHAEAERLFDQSLQIWGVVDPDEVLNVFTGLSKDPDEWTLDDPSNAWIREKASPHLPAPHFVWRGGSGTGRPGKQLAAVFEPEKGVAASYRLYSQVKPGLHQQYGHEQPVRRVYVLPFKALGSLKLLESERAVLSISDDKDGELFQEWMRAFDNAGHAWVPSLELYSSIYLSQVCMFLPGRKRHCICGKLRHDHFGIALATGKGSLSDGKENALIEVGASIFEIARLLFQADFSGGVKIRISGPNCPLLVAAGDLHLKEFNRKYPGLILFSCEKRIFVCNVVRKCLFEVPATLALLLEVIIWTGDRSAGIAVMTRLFDITADSAARLYKNGEVELEKVR
jgi:nucleoside-diphosphate-sugar epimerase